MYYNINRVLVNENYSGQKWVSGVECNLSPKSANEIVFDINLKTWKYQEISKWNSYLVSIGILKLQPSQKLDSNDKIVSKTNEELLAEGLVDSEFVKNIKTQEIVSNFETSCKKVGVALSGTFKIYGKTDNVVNPKFQYDKDSQFMLLQAKDVAEIPYWRSVDNDNIELTNVQKNSLYSLLLNTYFTKFAESRVQIDAL